MSCFAALPCHLPLWCRFGRARHKNISQTRLFSYRCSSDPVVRLPSPHRQALEAGSAGGHLQDRGAPEGQRQRHPELRHLPGNPAWCYSSLSQGRPVLKVIPGKLLKLFGLRYSTIFLFDPRCIGQNRLLPCELFNVQPLKWKYQDSALKLLLVV